MTDLIAIMSTLVDNKGRILIEGVYDEVAPLLPEEEALYTNITFDTVSGPFFFFFGIFNLFVESLLFRSWCRKNHSR